MTLRQLLHKGIEVLEKAGVSEPDLDANYLLMEAFRIDMAHFLLEQDRKFPQDSKDWLHSRDQYESWIEKRADRVPIQYILGNQEFMGLSFQVNPHVLIPRQDTETLVETVLKQHQETDNSILDLCTGSGCIAISLALKGKYRLVVGSDISGQALKTARKNGKRLVQEHGCNGVLCWIESDLFEQLCIYRQGDNQFDILVSNPPYIPTKVISELEPEVKDHEPLNALDGELDGLAFYRKIASEGGEYIKAGGHIYLEIGYDQAFAVGSLLRSEGFESIQIIKDEPGLNRVVHAVWPGK